MITKMDITIMCSANVPIVAEANLHDYFIAGGGMPCSVTTCRPYNLPTEQFNLF